MKKYFYKTFIIFLVSLIAFSFFDLYAFRGYFTSNLYSLLTTQTNSIGVANFEYKITKLEGDIYKFKIRNKSFFPVFVLTYRNDNILFNLKDSELINLASRPNIIFPKRLENKSYGFDCGTGLGIVSINPFEKFEDTVNYKNLLLKFNTQNRVSIIANDTIFDPFYFKPILHWDVNNNAVWNEDIERFISDSIDVKFFLPTHSIFSGEQMNAYSNVIKISYIDIVRNNKSLHY